MRACRRAARMTRLLRPLVRPKALKWTNFCYINHYLASLLLINGRIQNQNLTYTKSRAWRTQKFFMNTTFLPKKWKPLKKDFGVTPDASSCACSSSVVLAFFIHVRKMRKGWTHYLMSRCFSSLSNTLGQKLNFCPLIRRICLVNTLSIFFFVLKLSRSKSM